MHTLSKVAGVVLAAAALAAAGAAVACAATAPSTAAVTADAGVTHAGPSTARFFTYDTSSFYRLVVESYPDASVFVNPPATPETLSGASCVFFDLDTTGQTVAHGVVRYAVFTCERPRRRLLRRDARLAS